MRAKQIIWRPAACIFYYALPARTIIVDGVVSSTQTNTHAVLVYIIPNKQNNVNRVRKKYVNAEWNGKLSHNKKDDNTSKGLKSQSAAAGT